MNIVRVINSKAERLIYYCESKSLKYESVSFQRIRKLEDMRDKGTYLMDCLKLLRVKHWIKNFLIFVPLFFSGEIFKMDKLYRGVQGFLCFCLISSAVYVLNDICDRNKDMAHPTKRNRPLASGRIKKKSAIGMMTGCILLAVVLSLILGNIYGIFCLALYFGLNVAYSRGMKNKSIVDIVILASGFVIRIFYGGFITGVTISGWLYLVVVTGSFYMGLGKRRNELKKENNHNTREVLKYYNVQFLDKNMYVCAALVNTFYALWTVEFSIPGMIWTVPVFLIILLRYSYDIEGESDGDPVEVILKDKVLIALVMLYAVGIFGMIYIF